MIEITRISDYFERKTYIFIVILLNIPFHADIIDRVGAWHEKIFTIASNGITRDVTLERLPLERDPRST